MKLEQQVITISQAKRLKELGVVQENSLCVWFISSVGPVPQFRLHEETLPQEFAAYTVAELGEMIPAGYNTFRASSRNGWLGYDREDSPFPEGSVFLTEAECRAAMLIHLLENKLVTVEEINKRLQQ